MKHIQSKIVVCAMFAFAPLCLSAQDDLVANDSLSAANDKEVQIAFRKIKEKDLMGGVSVVHTPELMDKSYASYSLSNMSALTCGYPNGLCGMDGYLTLFDGVPRDARDVTLSAIDQIPFLKRAQAAVLYACSAAAGLIMFDS